MNPQRPGEHQHVIDLMQESKAPPADAETPNIPPEMLDRLLGQYGSAPEPERQRPREIIAEKPSVLTWITHLLFQPKFAFAALLMHVGLTAVMLNTLEKDESDLMRGPDTQPQKRATYWLADKAQPAPTGLGMPKFTVITSPNDVPTQGDALVFDPSKAEVRLLHNGTPTTHLPITDPTDNAEWLRAHRQLSQRKDIR